MNILQSLRRRGVTVSLAEVFTGPALILAACAALALFSCNSAPPPQPEAPTEQVESRAMAGTVSSVVYHQVPTNDVVYQGERWRNWTRAGLISNYVPQRNITLKRLTVNGHALTGPGWGVRAYDVIDWEIYGCRFTNIKGPRDTTGDGIPDKFVGEHDVYVNVAGNLKIRWCVFTDTPGQAIQTVFLGRTTESSDYEGFKDAGGTILVEDCVAIDVGLANPDHSQHGRASFAFSFFPSSQDVVLTRNRIDVQGNPWWSKNPSDPTAPRWNSYGGIMAQGHPYVELVDNEVVLENPDRELVQLRNCGTVVLVGGSLMSVGGRKKVTIDNCPSILVEGVESNADLYIDGVKVGPVSAGFVR
jgi:hypothetical protein